MFICSEKKDSSENLLNHTDPASRQKLLDKSRKTILIIHNLNGKN